MVLTSPRCPRLSPSQVPAGSARLSLGVASVPRRGLPWTLKEVGARVPVQIASQLQQGGEGLLAVLCCLSLWPPRLRARPASACPASHTLGAWTRPEEHTDPGGFPQPLETTWDYSWRHPSEPVGQM